MLEQALTTLAEAGGTAVVQAVGTDAWAGLRQALGRWFGRGDGSRERAELERLDRTAEELVTSAADQRTTRHEAAWGTRFETLLENLDERARAHAAEELRALLSQYAPQKNVSAGQGGLAAGRDIGVRAEGEGAIAAGLIQGGVHVGRPSRPDPTQG
ncbi:hypothetical protein ACFY8K_28435 [Streptomyces misionensis]|uniref:hypothetical protein n=1 Tax=Streptomyces TaxID=1883 RepID=UPI0036B81F10